MTEDLVDDDDMPLGLKLRSGRRKRRLTLAKQASKPRRRKPKERWELSHIPDEELTMWELCMRNRRVLTEEEKKAKRMKLNEQKMQEEKAQAERQKLLSELGASANDDVLDLFNAPMGAAGATGDAVPSAEPTDLFADAGPASGDLAQSDIFDMHEGYEFTTIEASETRHQLQPFAGAYKKTKAAQWSTADTNEFYKMLSQHGCDPMLIQINMPRFSMQQIISKITREMKRNSEIFEALTTRQKITTG